MTDLIDVFLKHSAGIGDILLNSVRIYFPSQVFSERKGALPELLIVLPNILSQILTTILIIVTFTRVL